MKCSYKDIQVEFQTPTYYNIDASGNVTGEPEESENLPEFLGWWCHNCKRRFSPDDYLEEHITLENSVSDALTATKGN